MSGHASFREIVTSLRGHDRWQLLSVLQKAIRRSDLTLALAAAAEMDQSGWSTMVWDRLEIIVSEDIGPIERGLAADVAALRATAEKYRAKGRRTGRLMLMHAVSALAMADKSRLADNAAHALYGNPKSEVRVPDWALDKHTAVGRRMGRDDEHFWTEGAKTYDPIAAPDDDIRDAEAHYLDAWRETPPALHQTWWETQRKDKDAPIGQTPEEDAAEKGRLL